jgi:hypothetical protein
MIMDNVQDATVIRRTDIRYKLIVYTYHLYTMGVRVVTVVEPSTSRVALQMHGLTAATSEAPLKWALAPRYAHRSSRRLV